MKKSIWKWLLLAVLTGWSISLVYPPKEKIKLGLDLQGGTSYTLEIIKEDLQGGSVKDARDRAIEVIRNRVDSMGVAEPNIYPDGEDRIVVQIPGMKAEDRKRASENIRRAAFLTFRMVHPANDQLVSALFAESKVPEGYMAVSMPSRSGVRGGELWVRKGPPPTEEERAKLARFEEKTGYDLLLEKEIIDGKEYFRPYYVNQKQELTGASLKSADVGYGNMGQRSVQFSLDARGRKIFGQLTSDYAPGGAKNPDPNSHRLLAIVLDGTLYSAPRIQTPILGGEGEITGSFTLEEASDLALVLRAGALPAPLRVLEERTVDPTLGTDSVNSGKMAALIGLAAVVVFTMFYYRFAGVVAALALMLNLVLLPLGMWLVAGLFGMFGGNGMGTGGGSSLPVMTLPGIAGIVLSVGMAVDANVLIFERIREEMSLGKRFGAALDAGYHKAFGTILDSNLTTLLAAVILFWQGSGPVKGFAITLSAGILASMYTAVVVTRMVFDLLEGRGMLNKLTMMQLVPKTNIDFIGLRKAAGVFSVVAIAATLGLFVHRGARNFGVDFTGGVQLSLSFEQKAEVDALRKALEGAPEIREAALIQYQRAGGEDLSAEVLALKVASAEESAAAIKVLQEQFPESKFGLLSETVVGPQVGEELKRSGMIAVGMALLGMILYITVRFEFSFAVGAVVGLVHNVLLTLGVYGLCGRQLTMTSIAAFLTVLGYSVNDTIVEFDRIRETRKLRGGRLDASVANDAINQCLARTLLTSITTALSVVALMVFGGGEVFDFALAMFIGVCVGTYASIFVATPVMLAVRPKAEGAAAAVPAKAAKGAKAAKAAKGK
jgi:SecD/SecF fusion protein